jgi:hypothetical protein
MIAAFLRLFALRPFFSMAILGFPLLLLVAVGLFTIFALKFIFFIVLPIALVVWLVRKLTRPRSDTTG